MLNKNIILKNFDLKKRLNKKFKISKILKKVLSEDNQILKSLGPSYKDSYNKKIIKKLKKNSQFRLIGMGGSILGSKAIYNFLSPKGKQFSFIDNLSNEFEEINSKKMVNVIISKSGNTLETISNSNIFISKNQSNFFITENKKSYLMNLANKLKAEIIHHNNFIGGRYSVLSEVGMLPAELMGFKPSKFRKLNLLIKNKNFFNSLVINVACMLELIYKNKKNSIILNYDQKSNDLFSWYQQLVAESLGKKSKGILPIVSNMPKDNHSLMQYYLEGAKNHFFTFFFVKEKVKKKIKEVNLFKTHSYLKGKNLNDILYSQFNATKMVFKKQNIPFRTFLIKKRNEEVLGELFTFFILETILLSKTINVNPFNQPSVELIKKQTKNILINS